MDTQLIVKIIHMSAATLAILVILARAMTLFVGTQDQQANPVARKLFVALQHLSLTVIVVTGIVALFLKNFDVQPWFYAKVVLFLVLLSSLMKAYRKQEQIQLAQRRAGVVLAIFALVAIIVLVMIKPNFG